MPNDFTFALRELRECVEFLLSLPKKLVETYYDTLYCYKTKRERIKRLQNLVEVREIAKSLSRLYSHKGDLVQQIERIKKDGNPSGSADIKFEVQILIGLLEQLREDISEVTIPDQALLLEASSQLGKALCVYRRIMQVPDDKLLDLEELIPICEQVQQIHEVGIALMKAADEQRKSLDYTY